MGKLSIATNLLGRFIGPSPRAPYAWWTKDDKSEAGYAYQCARAKVVAVWTEVETTGDKKGTSLLRVAAEALDGPAKGQIREMYSDHFLMLEE